MPPAVAAMVDFFARMEALLGQQSWLSGDDFGLADICVIPYVARISEIGLTAFWSAGASPRVEQWLACAMARPSYAGAFSQWMPEATAEMFRTFGEAARPGIETIIRNKQGRS